MPDVRNELFQRRVERAIDETARIYWTYRRCRRGGSLLTSNDGDIYMIGHRRDWLAFKVR